MVNAVQVASLYATLEIRDTLTGTLNNAKSSLKDFGGSLRDVGGTLTALGAPFLALAGEAIKAFSESEDALAQLDAVLKSTGGAAGLTRDQLVSMASAMQNTTRYSDETVLSAESMLLTFTNVGKDVFPRALKATANLSTAMKQDLKSSVIQIGKALNDPINAISSLTRVGVTFTEQTKDQIKAMVESGNVMGAQTLILQELDNEFGGSAEAAGKTFAGSLVILKNRFGDVLEVVGQQLIPIVQQFTGWIGQLITWFQNLDPSVQHSIVLAIAFAAGLAVIGPILIAIGAGISAIGALLAGPFLPIALIVGGLVLLAQHFGITLGQIQVYLSLIKLYAEYYFQGVVTAVQGVIKSLQDWAAANPELIAALGFVGGVIIGATLLTSAFSLAATVASGAVGLLSGAVGFLLSPVVILTVAIAALLFAINSLYPGGISGVLRDAGQSAQQLAFIIMYYLNSAVNWIRDRFNELLNTIQTVINKIIEFKNTIGGGLSAYGGAAQNASSAVGMVTSGQVSVTDFLNALNNAIGSQLGFASGGYTGSAPADQPVGVVHGKEWVVPENGALVLKGDDGGGITISNLTINANSAQGGRAASDAFSERLKELRRERG